MISNKSLLSYQPKVWQIIKWWNKLDANRERKERDHEKGRSVIPLEWRADETYLSGKPSYDMVLRKLMLAGDFLDFVFDRPETLHELVTDADFIIYESVYLPKNHFIKAETLSTEDYLSYFYPFDRLDFRKSGVESGWSVADREGIAITMAMGNAPQAVTMGFQKEYAERYDWIVKEFADLAFTFMTSFLYYLDYDSIDEDTHNLYRQGISAFGGIAPTYRIALEKDSPVIVWDFHSLLVMVQMCFSFMLTDKDSDMRMCKHCKKAFIASRKGKEFCSQKCKNQFNVYKSREKKKEN